MRKIIVVVVIALVLVGGYFLVPSNAPVVLSDSSTGFTTDVDVVDNAPATKTNNADSRDANTVQPTGNGSDAVVESANEAESLVAMLGQVDSGDSRNTKDRPLLTQRLSAFKALQALGDDAVPAVMARLQALPALEAQVLNRTSPGAVPDVELRRLQVQKRDLINVMAAIGKPGHGEQLLSVAQSTEGAGISSHAGVVMSLRKMGALPESQVYLDTLFKEVSVRRPGQAEVLDRLAVEPDSVRDAALAMRVAKAPVTSGLRGRGMWLAARLGQTRELSNLARQSVSSGIQDAAEVERILLAVAEALPPVEFSELTKDSKLVESKSFVRELNSATLHNRFWFANTADKEDQLYAMLTDSSNKNTVLALHYILSNQRTDLLMKYEVVSDNNLLPRLQDRGIKMASYSVPREIQQYAQLAGYRLTASGDQIQYEKIPGFGWYQ